MSPPSLTAEQIAQEFHEAYERLAPEFGYRTREESAVPWAEVPHTNRLLMESTVIDLLSRGVIRRGSPRAARRADVGPFVARRLREARAGNGCTQTDLAGRLGCSQACISLWESGKRAPSLSVLIALAGALGKDEAYFLPPRADERSTNG